MLVRGQWVPRTANMGRVCPAQQSTSSKGSKLESAAVQARGLKMWHDLFSGDPPPCGIGGIQHFAPWARLGQAASFQWTYLPQKYLPGRCLVSSLRSLFVDHKHQPEQNKSHKGEGGGGSKVE